jgi:predicted Zn-dependent protease
MGLAYAELGDFARAIELVEKGLHSGPGVTWAYRMLAAYHALAGNQEKAAAALAEFLRHNPGTTMEKLLHGMPPSLIANQPRYMEGLRKAGMPER